MKARGTSAHVRAARAGLTGALAIAVLAGATIVSQSPAQAQMSTFKGVYNWFTGKGGATQRNADNRERILSVLAHQRVVSVRDGRIEINNERALKEYYMVLRESGKLRNMPGYADDAYNEKAGQFWRNFFDGKDHTQPDLPTAVDPFANPNAELATKIHIELQSAANVGGLDYASTAAELKSRGIDVMGQELRNNVATGANVMIQALNAMTGGTSGQAVKWVEAAAEAGQKASENPTAAVQNAIKSKVDGAVSELVDDKVKAILGEDAYDKIMKGYEKYGDKQQRLKAFMDDMYEKTGDARFQTASTLLDKASTDEITKKLTEQSKELIASAKGKLPGADASKEGKADKDKEGKDGKDAKENGKEGPTDTGKKPADAKTAGETGKTGQEGEKKPESGKAPEAGKKPWAQMTSEEKRNALKANDPDAWTAFGKLVAADPSQAVAILDTKKPGEGTPSASGEDTDAGNIGEAIADAGAADIHKPSKPAAEGQHDAAGSTPHDGTSDAPAQTPQPVSPPAEAPPPPSSTAPPAAGTTKVEGGWLQDKNGKTKVVYILDAKGVRIGGYYVHYDKDGREIGRDTFKESGETQQQPSAPLDGLYQGRITGKSSGAITLTVSGSTVSGTINGVYSGDSFNARFSGALNSNGSFDAPAQGVLYGNWGKEVIPYRVSGRVSGRVDGRKGAGSWSGKNQWGSDQGKWQASK